MLLSTAWSPLGEYRESGYKGIHMPVSQSKAPVAQDDVPPPFSEDVFTRVGPARYQTVDDETSSDSDLPEVRTPVRRPKSEHRQHRAQPTRRAYNAR
jgi:hypothetical protein